MLPPIRRPFLVPFIFLGIAFHAVPIAHARPAIHTHADPAAPRHDVLAPELAAALRSVDPADRIPVVVVLRGYPDLRSWARREDASPAPGRAGRLIAHLRAAFERNGGPVWGVVARGEWEGEADEVRPFWIFGGFTAELSARAIREVADHPAVALVRIADPVAPPAPVEVGEPEGPSIQASEWNIAKVNAPDAWNLGYSGQGIVVGSFDTGVRVEHPDLSPRYRGGPGSWFDPYGEHATPADGDGHGTHTTGTILGGNASGRDIGVAPDARWIAAKAWTDNGLSSVSAFAEIFEWFLDPDGDPATDDAPAAVSNSWGFVYDGCLIDFRRSVLAWRAAGIVPVFASGNSGPGFGSSESPGNYPETHSVGATDSADRIASFSGRGPSDCDAQRIKPDLSAPGVSVKSSVGSGWQSWSGTSMATPHVTGAVALLRSVDSTLTVDEIEDFLDRTALDLGPAGPDNDFGWGRLDAGAAVQAVIDRGRLAGVVTDAQSGRPLAATITVVELDRVVRAGEDGGYDLALPSGDPFTIRFTAFGFEDRVETVTLAPGENRVLDVGLAALPVGAVSGVIQDDRGDPLAGAVVGLSDADLPPVTSGADGSYRLDGVPVGFTYGLTASLCDHLDATRSITVPDPGGLVVDLTLSDPGPDDMESDNGWSHGAISPFYGDQWHRSTERSHGGATAWKCGGTNGADYADYLDAGLVTRCITVPRGSTLSFWHWIDTERQPMFPRAVWDGGIVEVSEDDGATWSQITPAGGYPNTIFDNPANVLPAGTPCYGAYFDWSPAYFDLHDRSGELRFRFRFASDGLVTAGGWFVDDLAVQPTAPNLELTVVQSPPAVAPGDRMEWILAARNLEGRPVTLDFWYQIRDGSDNVVLEVPVQGPTEIAADLDAQYRLVLRVPDAAPADTYTVSSRAGVHPDVIYAQSDFQTTVQ